MATLTGNTIASTYLGVLNVSGAVGADTVEPVTDGAGTSTSLSLSQQRAKITLGTGGADDFIITNGSLNILTIEGDNSGTVSVGVAGTGHDVTFYSGTSGDQLVWDASEEVLQITGTDGQTSLDVLDGDVRVVDKIYFFDRDGEYISSDGTDLTIAAGTALNITADVIDLSDATKDVTLNAAVDALNFDSNTLSIDATNNRVGIGTTAPTQLLQVGLAGASGNGASISLAAYGGLSYSHGGYQIQVASNSNLGLYMDTDNSGSAHTTFYNYTTELIRINSSGYMGIGTVSPANPLAVNRSGDGVIVDFESEDTVEGTVSISGNTTSYNAFVGSHYTQLKDGQNDLPVGAVVISTGEIITCNLVAESTITNIANKEYFTYINTTTTSSNPAVYGTWLGKMSDDAKGHSFGDDDKPIYLVAQVGLFKIRVTDTNGNISNGDYLESSTRAMEAQKQTSTSKVNSTIGKSMIDVNWSSVETDTDLGYKWKLIPCTF